MFRKTTAIKKILNLKKRIKIIQGGTSAGKTFGILPVLIDRAARTEGIEISVVAETIPHLRRGALKDFLKIMKWTGRFFVLILGCKSLIIPFAHLVQLNFYPS